MKEHYPLTIEAESNPYESGIVQYQGGEMALFYSGEGRVVDWEYQKWVDHPADSGANLIIVTTESGNQYGLGNGFVINERKSIVGRVDHEAPIAPIEIGEQWHIPIQNEGYMRTTPVRAVTVRYKIGSPGYHLARQIDEPSSFIKLQQELDNWRLSRKY